ncbi:MAG TPA: PIN domain-containing protein [Chloroflexota bacterium]|nr:PIN domain-containing protein [Chloroflexota bacterium]
MSYLLDTGFWYALANRKEQQHNSVVAVHRALGQTDVYVPTPVITEVAYLIRRDMGAEALAKFLDLLPQSQFAMVEPNHADYRRAAIIIRKYSDAHIDFVDAVLVAIAERLEITRVLTLDQRHFRLFRPSHCPTFEILP